VKSFFHPAQNWSGGLWAALLCLCSIGITQAQIVTLGTFDSANGANPTAGLTLSSDSTTFYGTTSQGGNNGNGTVYSIAVTGGTISTVADFTYPGPTGSQPLGAVTLSSDGTTLYGTTSNGGTGGPSGGGTIYSVSATASNATPTTLYSFTGVPPDGSTPQGSLALSGTTLYGTTNQGGASGEGAVVSYNLTTSTESTLASFDYGTNGANPSAGVSNITLVGNNLYGTSSSGGTGNNGTIFTVPASGGTMTALASFASDGSNGAAPVGNLTLLGDTPLGSLLGTTSSGGANGYGSIFSVPLGGGSITTLYSFTSADGNIPVAGLTLNSGGTILYGTTSVGGADNDGTVFSFNLLTDSFSTLASFTGANGANPESDLTLIGSTLYGTTFQGGANYDGTVFSIDTTQAVPYPPSWMLSLICLGVFVYVHQRSRRPVV
jgi:uncharacterized repeat protein (TIGR03803 family)